MAKLLHTIVVINILDIHIDFPDYLFQIASLRFIICDKVNRWNSISIHCISHNNIISFTKLNESHLKNFIHSTKIFFGLSIVY
jgi:hypothetical protein